MAPRRDKTPPYEIMRSVTRGAQGASSGAPVRPEPPSHAAGGDQADAHAAAGAGPRSWPWSWAGVGVPITLRVPRGAAILAVVGLVGLLALAYWAGHTRGSAAAEELRAELIGGSGMARTAPDAPPGTEREPAADASTADVSTAGTGERRPTGLELTMFTGTGESVEAGSPDDPREPGLNYFIVARYLPDDAEELAAFLADHGVDTVLQPLNNGLVLVWVVNRGFTADERYGEAHMAFQAELGEIGRAWRQHKPGLRDALTSMYDSRYSGP